MPQMSLAFCCVHTWEVCHLLTFAVASELVAYLLLEYGLALSKLAIVSSALIAVITRTYLVVTRTEVLHGTQQ
jgi:hypothetical protein